MKTAIQRNLPLGIEYRLLSSWQSELEAGNSCQNCGKIIANCAEIESEHSKFIVGLDCAKTLCQNSLSVIQADSCFAMGKAARATLRKAIKNASGSDFRAVTFSDSNNFYKEAGAGKWEYTLPTGGSVWKQYPAYAWASHVLPMIKDLVKCTFTETTR